MNRPVTRARRCSPPGGSPIKSMPSLLLIRFARLLLHRVQSCDHLIEASLDAVNQRDKEKENYQKDDGVGHIVGRIIYRVANDQPQPPTPAATEQRLQHGKNGWLLSAECCRSVSSSSLPRLLKLLTNPIHRGRKYSDDNLAWNPNRPLHRCKPGWTRSLPSLLQAPGAWVANCKCSENRGHFSRCPCRLVGCVIGHSAPPRLP